MGKLLVFMVALRIFLMIFMVGQGKVREASFIFAYLLNGDFLESVFRLLPKDKLDEDEDVYRLNA